MLVIGAAFASSGRCFGLVTDDHRSLLSQPSVGFAARPDVVVTPHRCLRVQALLVKGLKGCGPRRTCMPPIITVMQGLASCRSIEVEVSCSLQRLHTAGAVLLADFCTEVCIRTASNDGSRCSSCTDRCTADALALRSVTDTLIKTPKAALTQHHQQPAAEHCCVQLQDVCLVCRSRPQITTLLSAYAWSSRYALFIG